MYVSISITAHSKEIIIKSSIEIYNYWRNFHISYAELSNEGRNKQMLFLDEYHFLFVIS